MSDYNNCYIDKNCSIPSTSSFSFIKNKKNSLVVLNLNSKFSTRYKRECCCNSNYFYLNLTNLKYYKQMYRNYDKIFELFCIIKKKNNTASLIFICNCIYIRTLYQALSSRSINNFKNNNQPNFLNLSFNEFDFNDFSYNMYNKFNKCCCCFVFYQHFLTVFNNYLYKKFVQACDLFDSNINKKKLNFLLEKKQNKSFLFLNLKQLNFNFSNELLLNNNYYLTYINEKQKILILTLTASNLNDLIDQYIFIKLKTNLAAVNYNKFFDEKNLINLNTPSNKRTFTHWRRNRQKKQNIVIRTSKRHKQKIKFYNKQYNKTSFLFKSFIFLLYLFAVLKMTFTLPNILQQPNQKQLLNYQQQQLNSYNLLPFINSHLSKSLLNLKNLI